MSRTTPRIPPSNPKANYLAHKEEINEAIARVLNSGHYILGDEVRSFEREFAAYIGVRFGIGVGSGTDALSLAMRACHIGMGDEVVTVSHTAVATVAAIELCGGRPVLVDIDSQTFTLDPNQVDKAITKSTKAIVPVHLYGHPAEMQMIVELARHHGLRVIEDCAQSHGASYKARKTGKWGDIAAFSFYPTKNLGALGDGGMVVTDNSELAEEVQMLREYGWRSRYVSEFAGVNSRLDELQAAILRVKLGYLDGENQKRQALASVYGEVLSTADVVLPKCAPDATHVYHQYVLRSKRRDALKSYLLEKGIGTLIHYPLLIHQQPAYRYRVRAVGSMANSNTIVKEILSLPIYPELSQDDVRKIAKTIVEWC